MMMAIRVPTPNHPALEDFQAKGSRDIGYRNALSDVARIRDTAVG